MTNFEHLELYLKTGIALGKTTFNRNHLCNLFDLEPRTVRQAFYNLKHKGIVILNDKEWYTVITDKNCDEHYDEIIRTINSDKKEALKKLKYINKQIKSLPQKFQERLGIEND